MSAEPDDPGPLAGPPPVPTVAAGPGAALGRLALRFLGTDFVSAAVAEEIRSLGTGLAGCTGSLVFRFGAVAEPGPGSVLIDEFAVSPDVVRRADRHLPCSLSRRPDGTLEVGVASGPGPWKLPPAGPVVRLLDRSYDDAAHRLAKRFFYTIFDQAVQIAQLPLGQSWLHCSAVTGREQVGPRTILFSAWGGVGKTSILLRLLETGDWRFLSDDLAVFDDHGTVHRTPKKMQLYPYNFVGEAPLRQRLLGHRQPADLLHWNARYAILGGKAVRRRVHVEEVFGRETAAVSAPVTDAVHLRRTTDPVMRIEQVYPHEFAALSAAVLPIELQPMDRWLAAIHAAGPGLPWPTTDEAAVRAAAIIEQGLQAVGARCSMVSVPTETTPRALLAFLKEEVIDGPPTPGPRQRW